MILQKQKKRKRIRMMSDEEESGGEEKDDRRAIEEELFEGGEEASEVGETPRRPDEPALPGQEFGDLEASEDESGGWKSFWVWAQPK